MPKIRITVVDDFQIAQGLAAGQEYLLPENYTHVVVKPEGGKMVLLCSGEYEIVSKTEHLAKPKLETIQVPIPKRLPKTPEPIRTKPLTLEELRERLKQKRKET